MKKSLLLVFLLLCCGSLAVAQSTVTGKITEDTGEPLPFVNVSIKGTTTGTTSDLEGVYKLSASSTDTLVFSFLGYKSAHILVGNQTVINVTLLPDVTTLADVVVVGYATTRKKDLTGSVAVMDPEELTKFPVTSIGQAMQGRLAGVQVVNANQPGENPQILVRGFGTIFGDPNPLVVIDGLQTGIGALANIDPNSIESVQVLKDASAAAIYGSRAANGVIILTTKKGRKEYFEVNYTSELGVQMAANRFDLMNTTEHAEYTSRLYRNSSTPLVPRMPPSWTTDPTILATNTDWQSEVLRPALMHTHNLNFSGGGKNSTYYIGMGYLKQDGIIDATSFERINLQVNTQVQQKKFTFGESINLFARFKPESGLVGTPVNLYSASPQMPVFDPNNLNGLGAPIPSITGANNTPNPLAYRFLSTQTNGYGLLGNLFAEYTFIEGLSVRSDLNLDVANGIFERFRQPLDQSQAAITRIDYDVMRRQTSSVGINSETLIKYNKTIGKHVFSALSSRENLVLSIEFVLSFDYQCFMLKV